MMKLLHALAALLTVLLFLVRHSTTKRVCLTKRSDYEPPFCLYADASEASLPRRAEACQSACQSARTVAANVCRMPKCKRDPDIQIDNENIGVYPRG